MSETQAIGIDLGATKIAIALVTSRGKVLDSRTIPTEKEQGPEAVLRGVAHELNDIAEKSDGDVQGVGIGVPGLVRPDEGILIYSTNLAWSYVHIIEEIESELETKFPVRIQTDSNACILGEYCFGAARGCEDFLYTSVGSGLGGAVMCNGRLVTGANNTAGFMGLYSLDPQGRTDPSGLRGNTEAVVSGRGLVTIMRELLAEAKNTGHMLDSESLLPEEILGAAERGDELANAALAEMGRYLGQVWTPAVAVLNPARIVLAGGLGLAAFDFLVPAARKELEARLTPVSYADLEILPSNLESSAVGAACLIFANTAV
jgi:glucokinase